MDSCGHKEKIHYFFIDKIKTKTELEHFFMYFWTYV